MYIYAGGVIAGEMHVNEYLSQVHNHMFQKFKKMSESGDKENAKELEIFFQKLKDYVSRQGSNKENLAGNAMYDMLVDKLQEIETRRGGRHQISTLFTRQGTGREAGFQFERDLGDVIQGMMELAVDKHLIKELSNEQLQQIIIGDVKGSTKGVVDVPVAKVLREIEEKTKTKLSSEEKPPYTLVDVYGKVDVTGLNVELNINGNTTGEFERILSLLNNATFSAKSYRSISYSGEAQKMLDEIRPDLHLGNSNPYRAISGVLSTYGAEMGTIQSAFCASWYDWKNGNDKTGLYIYRLRYIYELTGMGIINNDGSTAELVKYFIYNDPSGAYIYVASTAEIIFQIMSDETNIDNPFGRDIVIKKASMRQHRYH